MLKKTSARVTTSKRAACDFQVRESQLLRQRNELLEEVSQLRAAMLLWAKVAETTCKKCNIRNCGGTASLCDRQPSLISVSEALQLSTESSRLNRVQ